MILLKPIQIIIAEGTGPLEGKYLAQCNSYPVINGRGQSIDEAVEALLLAILVHMKGRRTRGVNFHGYRMESY